HATYLSDVPLHTLLTSPRVHSPFLFFFFHDTATTEIYTLSLHYALPISTSSQPGWIPRQTPMWPNCQACVCVMCGSLRRRLGNSDRKSTRLNSSHVAISYAVFCLKKKKNNHSAPPLKVKIHIILLAPSIV